MKRRTYIIAITLLSVVLAAAFISYQLGGFAPRSVFGAKSARDYVDGDYVGYISPKSKSVTDGASALAATADIFGVNESQLSLALEEGSELRPDERFYRFQQMYGDLPVYGRSASLAVSDENVYLASGSLRAGAYAVDTVPTISEADAHESLRNYALNTLLDGNEPENFSISLWLFSDENLCIYDQGQYSNDPRLAYACAFTYSGGDADNAVFGSFDALVDAHTAQILSVTSNVYTASTTEYLTYTSDFGSFDLSLERSGNTYIFQDQWRNFVLYDAQHVLMNKDGNDIIPSDSYSADDVAELSFFDKKLFSGEAGDQLQPYTISVDAQRSDNLTTSDTRALKLFSHAQATYDFYYCVLGRKGYNHGNGQMNLVINNRYRAELGYSKYYGNATILAFEWSTDLNSLSVVGHEFTHSVERSISCMEYSGESGAIMEGYSDTFGVLAEAYTCGREPTWECCGRDLSQNTPFDESDYMHQYSYMVANPAYCIWNDWTALGVRFSEKIDDMAHLYYRALYLMDKYATYDQWRWAMEQVAKYMLDEGELTQAQYDAVISRLGAGRSENAYVAENFDMFKTVAVLLAQEYERGGEWKLTDDMREYASISLIPEIVDELYDQVGLTKSAIINERVETEVNKKTMFYYLAALFGENYASRFACGGRYRHIGNAYCASYQSTDSICEGWTWEITRIELLDDINIGFHATLVSPDNASYTVIFLISQDEGSYTGAFLNGYYLCDMGVIPNAEAIPQPAATPEATVAPETPVPEVNNEEILTNLLNGMAEAYGVIEVGTEEYQSQNGGFERVIPGERISGLLSAEMDDYDGDGCVELFVVRVEPRVEKLDGYSTGQIQEIYKTCIILEVYDVKAGNIVCSGQTFPIFGLQETEYQASAHVFRTTDSNGIKLYFDHFFNFNSQTFATIQLEYDGEALCVTGGAELDEYAYSVGCYRAVSDEACSTILGRQSYDIGQNGWEERYSGYWDTYDDTFENETWNAFGEYDAILGEMGLSESISRSMFWGDWDGGAYALFPIAYGRCYLKPAEHFTCNSGKLDAVCSLIAPYDQSRVTLAVEDETALLYPYRTGVSSFANSAGD